MRQLHSDGRLHFYVDCHAHSNKRGCFLFGNALDLAPEMLANVLYARLMQNNCRWFDFEGCEREIPSEMSRDSELKISRASLIAPEDHPERARLRPSSGASSSSPRSSRSSTVGMPGTARGRGRRAPDGLESTGSQVIATDCD